MRRVIKLMSGWHITDGSGRNEAVELPHTWNAQDGQDGGDDYCRGKMIYDNRFPCPDFDRDRECVYLQFHGVNASASVMLNEKNVCRHDGGYSTFRVDVTDVLERENSILVEVDNGVNERVYPQKADFTFYGGIYRDVELLIVNRMHFDLDYYGWNGIRYTAAVLGKDADIHATAFINEAAEKAGAQVVLQLVDGGGTVVAEEDKADAVLHVADVHLWDGLHDPYLYELKAFLQMGGETVDEVSCSCGVRTFEFRPEDGFYLNGKPYPLHGVARHQDYKGIGNALTRAHHDRDMELICEVGANTIRLAHYQHDRYFYDLCDRTGMIVWAEIPYISEHLADGDDNTETQLRELIVQNDSHPCIVVWGISNEITISGRKKRAQMIANHRRLNDLCHEIDPSRPTTLACYAMCHPFHPVTKITDLIGWNLYLGWYIPGLFLNDWWISFYHRIYPKRCLCYSEYGAEGMPNLHAKRPRRGDNSEEYQLKYHEFMLACFARHPYMWAYYYWNMFDFAADARNQGGEPGMNHKGMVSFDRKTKKDVFYLYKAHWNQKDKFVYIAGKRYEFRSAAKQTITVYSNLDEVSLYQNGRLIDTRTGKGIFKFRIKLEAENRLEARAGEYTNCCVIYRTDREKPEYRLKSGDSSNWM